MTEITHDEYVDGLASEALQVCAWMREVHPDRTQTHLTAIAARNPRRAAQLLMVLATWVDYEGPTSALTRRAAAVAEGRAQAEARRVSRADIA